MKRLYSNNGPPTEIADRIGFSLPTPVGKVLHRYATQIAKEVDRPILEGLKKAGFKLDFGTNDSGIIFKVWKCTTFVCGNIDGKSSCVSHSTAEGGIVSDYDLIRGCKSDLIWVASEKMSTLAARSSSLTVKSRSSRGKR